MKKTPKTRNPNDLTLRNLRAHAKRLGKLEADVKALKAKVRWLVSD